MAETNAVADSNFIGDAMDSLDKAMVALRRLDELAAAQQRADAARLREVASYSGIKIFEDATLSPNEVTIHVGAEAWRLLCDSGSQPQAENGEAG